MVGGESSEPESPESQGIGSQGIGLADMIISLREELLAAQNDPLAAQLPLVTGPVELELSVAVTRTTEGGARARFWVLDAGGSHEHSGATTQSFKITLNPTDPVTGEPWQVSRRFAARADRGE